MGNAAVSIFSGDIHDLRACRAQGLATGQNLALVLEREPEGPLRGSLQNPGRGAGVAEK